MHWVQCWRLHGSAVHTDAKGGERNAPTGLHPTRGGGVGCTLPQSIHPGMHGARLQLRRPRCDVGTSATVHSRRGEGAWFQGGSAQDRPALRLPTPMSSSRNPIAPSPTPSLIPRPSLTPSLNPPTKPLPSRHQAATKPRPSRYQAATKPLPSRYQAATKPLPSRYQAATKPLPSHIRIGANANPASPAGEIFWGDSTTDAGPLGGR